MTVEEVDEDGSVEGDPRTAVRLLDDAAGLPRRPAVLGIEGLTNPRGFIIVDKHQRNPTYPNVFGVGVCVAIAADGPDAGALRRAEDRLHDRIHGHGDGAQYRRAAAAARSRRRRRPGTPSASPISATSGVAFVAQPQIPPRNVNWASKGKWVHLAKIAFEKYFMRKMRRGKAEPFYEKFMLERLEHHQAEGRQVSRGRPMAHHRSARLRGDQPDSRRQAGERRPRCGSCKAPLFAGQAGRESMRRLSRSTCKSNDIAVLVDVWAPWCGPCRAMAPNFEKAAAVLEPDVRLLKLNADKERRARRASSGCAAFPR